MSHLVDLFARICFVGVWASVARALCTVVYRVWFHPLAKYPGPFWAKVTDAYGSYHAWKGDLHLDMWKCHLKYGDKSLKLSIWIDIYAIGANVKKATAYTSLGRRSPNTLTLRDKKQHASRRRIISQGLSDSALRTYEETIDKHIDNFIERLSKGDTANIESTPTGTWSVSKNMARWCEYLAFDITVDVVFGDQFEMISKANNRPVLEAIAVSSKRVGVLMQNPELKGSFLDKLLFQKGIVARRKLLGFVDRMLKNKNEQHRPAQQNVLTMLLNGKDQTTGEMLSPSVVLAESTTLIVAGTDTTATALSAFFFYVSRSPTAYEKVSKEIRTTFNSVDDIKNRQKLNSCLYLRACIDEAMRMSPSVGSSLWREVENEGMTVDKDIIPGGYDVGVAIYSIHHKDDYFPQPFSFIPERWTPDGKQYTRESVELARAAFNPFSIGPRSCVGKGLAMFEMTRILATTLLLYDFRVVGGPEGRLGEGSPLAGWGRDRQNELQLCDHVTSATTGPLLQFKRRDNHASA
ncbi:hypothetical protein LOZ39_003991 [Ophidiomyces ophidiicola]|uniref:Uncharacterized protein n=1 Tax=Ophidiomyces ophidiicola TaxID=1387563 RepID=A0ACB8V237_9EURO|nr:hypothetical protein LOZ60_002786 [Ophidiomyces ophidiicola]KAI2021279.1 hypothetical protein LOZ45_004826 [Ophidiomyces ophidiicola]KAI2073497.1 hypothetical protein LOZ39_003991 [Ophidiomyces ophidiicola]KAI2076165.1 hypothetical protein LOZ37_003252 [Ophidiomyces ophidiicola]KAI2088599.1 hypothetical protein LOZ36_002196 [Ophidiomyces ophidiicola]